MTAPADGIHPGMGFVTYLALEAWGSSSIKAMRIGPPARVMWERANPRETDATVLGTAAHAAILTPDLFRADYDVKPWNMTFASKEGKAWRDDPSRAGKIILPFDIAAQVEAIRDAVLGKPGVYESLSGAVVEASLLWTCPTTGERCKGRPDWFDGEYVYDLKVTRHAGPSLAYQAYAQGWMHQLAHNRTGLRAVGIPVRTGRLVAVHPDAPHYVWCVECREADLDVLALETEGTLKAMRECRLAGEWPGTPDEWTRIEMPQYAIKETVSVADAMEVDDGQ